MKLSLRLPLLALLWLAGDSSPAWAGPGFQPVSPDELKMTSEPLAPGAHAIILYRQVDRDDNAHTSHEDNYFRIKILTEEGREYAGMIKLSLEDLLLSKTHRRMGGPMHCTDPLKHGACSTL